MQPLILASASPRRRQLLSNLALEFSVQVADVDESLEPAEPPNQVVLRLSKQKAMTVGSKQADPCWILAADTVVALQGEILGKPGSPQEAREMLSRLRGNIHQVWTGVALQSPEQLFQVAVKTAVHFRDFNDDELEEYVNTGEPMDKAGAYGIQGWGGLLTKGIEGSWSNVVGLPLEATASLFRQAGRPLSYWKS